jgi:hypothetical protein
LLSTRIEGLRKTALAGTHSSSHLAVISKYIPRLAVASCKMKALVIDSSMLSQNISKFNRFGVL